MTLIFHEVGADDLADTYANDQRVTRVSADRYLVDHPNGERYHLVHNGILGWCLYAGPNLDMVQLPRGGVTDANLAIGYQTAGGMIQALIGEPRTGGEPDA